jgi:hypothetical protein
MRRFFFAFGAALAIEISVHCYVKRNEMLPIFTPRVYIVSECYVEIMGSDSLGNYHDNVNYNICSWIVGMQFCLLLDCRYAIWKIRHKIYSMYRSKAIACIELFQREV